MNSRRTKPAWSRGATADVNLTRHQIACGDLPHNYDDMLTFGDTAKGSIRNMVKAKKPPRRMAPPDPADFEAFEEWLRRQRPEWPITGVI